MLLPYEEYKEVTIETYESLHKQFNYLLSETFYSLLHDFENSEEYGDIDKVLFYIFFADICLANKESIDFMKEELEEIFADGYILQFKNDLGENFNDFLSVVERVHIN